MVGELITLPLRLTGLAARLWWRTTEQAVTLGYQAAGYIVERVSPGDSGERAPGFEPERTPRSAPATVPRAPTDTSTEPPPSTKPLVAAEVREPRVVTPAEEPRHVSEEPELVEEFAEAGAQDGAGAEVHVDEPWEGYEHMNVREVTERLAQASAAELAAVQLYEASNRGRQSILAAVGRQMRSANGSGSRT